MRRVEVNGIKICGGSDQFLDGVLRKEYWS